MDALPERVEVLASLLIAHDDLAVEHVAPGGKLELGEVAPERLARARLQEDLIAVDEGQTAKAVELDLIDVVLTDGQLLARERELGLDGGLEREGHLGGCIEASRRIIEPKRETAATPFRHQRPILQATPIDELAWRRHETLSMGYLRPFELSITK